MKERLGILGLVARLCVLSVLVAGRWGLDIKGEFVTVDHDDIISGVPTCPL